MIHRFGLNEGARNDRSSNHISPFLPVVLSTFLAENALQSLDGVDDAVKVGIEAYRGAKRASGISNKAEITAIASLCRWRTIATIPHAAATVIGGKSCKK